MDILNVPMIDVTHGVPKSHRGAHFDNYDFGGQADLKTLTCRFIDGERFWLYLHGRTGRGKTHYAVALHRAVVAVAGFEGADSSVFTTWADLVRDLRASFEDYSYDERLASYLESDTLVIDDVTGKLKDFEVRILEEVVQQRHANDRRLVITSNEDYERFLGLFGEHEVSRVRSVCVAAEFIGSDRRVPE